MTRDQILSLVLLWAGLGGTILMFAVAAAKDALDRAPLPARDREDVA